MQKKLNPTEAAKQYILPLPHEIPTTDVKRSNYISLEKSKFFLLKQFNPLQKADLFHSGNIKSNILSYLHFRFLPSFSNCFQTVYRYKNVHNRTVALGKSL
jgi:hypothetical protein